jgi:PadR family transcriptional regulator, regulatory protein PadR
VTEDSKGTRAKKNGQRAPRLHGDLLTGSLLAFLRNYNAHGYELAERLREAGLPAFDSGTIYRTLRQLERSGLVSSFWDMSPSGPARRMYSLTKTGEAFLSTWIDVLQHYEKIVQSALKDYERNTAWLRKDDAPKPARRRKRQS